MPFIPLPFQLKNAHSKLYHLSLNLAHLLFLIKYPLLYYHLSLFQKYVSYKTHLIFLRSSQNLDAFQYWQIDYVLKSSFPHIYSPPVCYEVIIFYSFETFNATLRIIKLKVYLFLFQGIL